jgi:hypothetical protein
MGKTIFEIFSVHRKYSSRVADAAQTTPFMGSLLIVDCIVLHSIHYKKHERETEITQTSHITP